MAATFEEEGARAPWTLGDVAKSVVFIAVVTILSVAGIILARFAFSTEAALALALVGAFAAEMAMLAAVWLFGLRKYRVSWSALGFRPVDPMRGFVLVSVVLVLSFAVNVIYVQVISYLSLDQLQPPPILPNFLTGPGRLVIALALASLVAPVVEETFFRGFVFTALKQRAGAMLAGGGSALLFTLAHLQASVLVPIFVLGLLQAWLYEKTRSIWPCITLHCLYNSFALIAAYTVEVSKSAT